MLGWQYLVASSDDQKYKENACLLEKAKLRHVTDDAEGAA